MRRHFTSVRSPAVLFVADLFHPIDDFAIERFLDCDVCYRRGWRGAMPMLLVGRKPNHVARTELLNQSALALNPAAAGCHDQGLPQRMCMPSGACAGLERDARAGCAGWSVSLE